jgi:hypothetical protein
MHKTNKTVFLYQIVITLHNLIVAGAREQTAEFESPIRPLSETQLIKTVGRLTVLVPMFHFPSSTWRSTPVVARATPAWRSQAVD